MAIDKLNKLVNSYGLTKIIKISIIVIILYLTYRILLHSSTSTRIEGFQTLGYSNYGNQLSLQDPTNTPVYAGNTCTFKFDDVYRIEAFTLQFNNKPNISSLANAVDAFNPENIKTIYVQYEDGNGNMRYIKSSVNSSPPNYYNTTDLTTIGTKENQQHQIRISDITDENSLAVFTSKIIVSIGDNNNKIDTYIDTCNNGFISNFAFWGSSRDMLSKKDFENMSGILNLRTFANGATNYDESTNADSYTFTTSTDFLLYGISLNYNTKLISSNLDTSNTTNPLCSGEVTASPFKLSILYNNGLYSGNNFTINTLYTVRSDRQRVTTATNNEYIIFAQPVIANKLVITIPRINTTSQKTMKLICTGLQGYGAVPTQNNISDYQRTVNALLSAGTKNQSLDICPSVDDLVVKQNQAQQICDNLEYQDKVKSEKIRLERNKQYLLKLQQQQEQIDKLNNVITTLDNKRQQRAKNADIARVLQYQQQKGTASTVRDLANQRLQAQDNNQLYVDLQINNLSNSTNTAN